MGILKLRAIRLRLVYIAFGLLVSSQSFGLQPYEALKTAWLETQQTMLSETASPEQKSAAVDHLFAEFKATCSTDCAKLSTLVQGLNSPNSPLHRPELQGLLQKVSGLSDEKIKLNFDQYKEQIGRLQAYLEKNPELLQHQVEASFDLLRAVIQVEETALFKVLQKDPEIKKEGTSQLVQDVTYMTKQAQALVALGKIFQKGDLKSVTPEQMKDVVEKINELGIFYIKLAQSVSNMNYLLPQEVADPLKLFQDSVAPMDAKEVVEILTEELGRDPREVFVDFDPTKPLASGSIAGTYTGKVRKWNGTLAEVVIKVQRRGLEKQLEFNRKLNHLAMKALLIKTPEKLAPVLDLVTDQIIGLENAFSSELDFRTEARNMRRFKRLFRFQSDIIVPAVLPEMTTQRILVMEKLSGQNLGRAMNELFAMPTEAEAQVTPRNGKNKTLTTEQKIIEKTFSNLLSATFYMTVAVGEMHADLHPGNILAENLDNPNTTPTLSLLDFGQTVSTRGFLVQPLRAGLALLSGDAHGLAKQLAAMAVPGTAKPEALEALIREIFAAQKLEKISTWKLVKSKVIDNRIEPIGKSLGEILKRAYTEQGYRASGRYAQMMRSLTPVSGALIALGKKLPTKVMTRALLKSFALGVSVGYIEALTLKFPEWLGRKTDPWTDTWRGAFERKFGTLSGAPKSYGALRCVQVF